MSDHASYPLTNLIAPTWRRADNFLALADKVARLGPDRRDPERFHIDKSEIVAELRKLAREVSRG
ncbi:hypothetical protein [Pleomorphomonas sp. JP5]|uniref:hypothetical protein n=1 Tax=Pleomorphomonas sp. JP5 TaxID=2942998 RepID=UPI00204372EF|nr:hypothetical protein [Pleomorphomonas sp. JP5]MCM5558082.1 hypothetical protein [Pleomorphomonas sp. JP5]